MGYLTEYNLEIVTPCTDEIREAIERKLVELEVIGYALDYDFSCCDCVKWYGYEKDMKKLSEAFPEIHFLLSGIGEASDDQWKHHFLGGKSTKYYAEICFPPFDAADLR